MAMFHRNCNSFQCNVIGHSTHTHICSFVLDTESIELRVLTTPDDADRNAVERRTFHSMLRIGHKLVILAGRGRGDELVRPVDLYDLVTKTYVAVCLIYMFV
jgi:hypothetical protein